MPRKRGETREKSGRAGEGGIALRRALHGHGFCPTIPADLRLRGDFGDRAGVVHALPLDALRATLFGRLVLGPGFLWSDLVCYAAGIAIGVVAELALRVRRAV